MFSRRTDWGKEPEPWHAFVAARRTGRGAWLDLTVSNPTRVGLHMPARALGTIARVDASSYEPEPLGEMVAREAVTRYYRARGRDVAARQVWLTASTSEAYSGLLAIAGDPGDAILTPRPGYPLVEFLADIAGVHAEDYQLAYDGAWHLPASSLEAARRRCERSGRRVAAVVAVAPSNPLGVYLRRDELERLQAFCSTHDCMLIVDEVFSDYDVARPSEAVPTAVGSSDAVMVVLSGLSKVAALPQAKLAWGVVAGPARATDELMERLARVNDTYLSATTAVQRALPDIFAGLDAVQAEIRDRVRSNYRRIVDGLDGAPISTLPCEGGWSVVLQLPAGHADLDGLELDNDDDASDLGLMWAAVLLLRHDVRVQPGSAFGLEGPYVVASLLTPPSTWCAAVERLARLA